MKKCLAVVLALIMICSVVAFGTAEEYDLSAWGAGVKEQLGGSEITVLLASHDSTTAMLTMIDDFTELTGIKVNTKVLASTEMKSMQRSNSSTKSAAYDVYMVDAFTIYEYSDQGWLEPLNDRLADSAQTPDWFDYEDILLAFRDGIASVHGTAYAIPIAGESRFIGYRTDLFEKYNVAIPTTTKELLEVAQFFNGKEDGLYGIIFRGAAGTLCGSAHMSIAYCFGDDPIYDHTTGEFVVDGQASIDSIQYFLELCKCGPEDIASYNHEDAATLFAQGKAAMWMDATSMASMVEDPSSSTVAGKVGYFNIPDGPAGGSGAIAGWSLAVPTDAKNRDGGWAFTMYMSSRALSKTYNLRGGIPCRVSSFDDEEITAKTPRNVFIKAAIDDAGRLVERGVKYNYDSPYVLTFMKIIGDQINRAMIGEITAQEAARNAQAGILESLEEE